MKIFVSFQWNSAFTKGNAVLDVDKIDSTNDIVFLEERIRDMLEREHDVVVNNVMINGLTILEK